MQKRTFLSIGVVALAVVASTGCVSKKVFRSQVEETDKRISGVETGVEANEKRVGDLATETDTKIASVRGTAEKAVEIGSAAQATADEAKQMAKGKLLWQTTLSDDNVKFSFDQNELPAAATAILDDLATKVKSMDKAVYLEIEGHTDNIGSEEYNKVLGERRAEAVREYLSQKAGIPLHAMNIISYGEDNPVAENSSSTGRAKNRRVVIKVLE